MSKDKSGNVSLQAMAWLRDQNLPSDPICYHVAYELFDQPSAKFKKRMKHFEMEDIDKKKQIQQIYDDFVASSEKIQFNVLADKISELADRTLFTVSDTSTHLKSYSERLIKSKPLLESSSDDASMNVISLLIRETTEVNKRAQLLEKQLIQSTTDIQELQKEHFLFKNRARHDPLTKILNRRGMFDKLDELTNEGFCSPLSILLIDIDLFKIFNDEYGHLIGDNILKLVATTLKKNIKLNDILARFGGEEFILLLPFTSKKNGVLVAEMLRKKVASLKVKKRNSDEYLSKVTISIGVSEITDKDSLTDGIELADKALYQSKSNGRNCVTEI